VPHSATPVNVWSEWIASGGGGLSAFRVPE
jgi:hypothetical protein